MGMKSAMGAADRMGAGIRDRMATLVLPRMHGRVVAVVRDLELDKVVQRVESRNTIVNGGVAAMVLRLLPASVHTADDTTEGNQYNNRHVNHWRMGIGAGDGTVTTPAAADADLQHTGTLTEGNGAGPWYKEMDEDNFHLGEVEDDGSITYEDDQDEVDSVVVKITMAADEGSGAVSGGVAANKTYYESGLFFFYAGLTANGDHGAGERLFARSTFAPITKTPTRQVDLTWEITGTAS